MIAHLRKERGSLVEQPLREHLQHVALLMEREAQPLGLCTLARLIGLLHDMGKGTRAFYDYLLESVQSGKRPAQPIVHASAGAIFCYERWCLQTDSTRRRALGQTLAMIIQGHHGGLRDALCPEGGSPFLNMIKTDKRTLYYEEALAFFEREVSGFHDLDHLFDLAYEEVECFLTKQTRFNQAMLTRLMLSYLVDADRWDSACFEYGEDALADTSVHAQFTEWTKRLETYITGFREDSDVNRIRSAVSQRCLVCAQRPAGLFSLTVPTGGGKTLASLRFALHHAQHLCSTGVQINRIFYVVPLNTVLEQNADCIRRALDNPEGLLEHHGNVTVKNEMEWTEYQKLTERWDSPIILTSMVQFLNTLFRKENSDARRMNRFCGSVIVFDEIQALPPKCTRLFEKAITFLVQQCHCSVLLCSATQPCMKFDAQELMQDVPKLFAGLRRVAFASDMSQAMHNEQAATRMLELLDTQGSAMLVTNTRGTARDIYHCLIRQGSTDCTYFHLSNNLCAAHRSEKIDAMKKLLKAGKRVACVSTALIEAGVDISFPCVIRSLAGLPSILQAAGRCNRNAELPDGRLGQVYIWRLADEELSKLEEITKGQALLLKVNLEELRSGYFDTDSVERYFKAWREDNRHVLNYPVNGYDLVDLLSKNSYSMGQSENKLLDPMAFHQAFRTAGEKFHVIEENTHPIVVPYGAGKTLIEKLTEKKSMKETILLLRQLQRYTVNVYAGQFARIEDKLHPVSPMEGRQINVLDEPYYDEETGLSEEPVMNLLLTI